MKRKVRRTNGHSDDADVAAGDRKPRRSDAGGFYRDDAVLRVVDALIPPSRPRDITGREAIGAYFADVCGRTMTHRVDMGVIEGDRLAFSQSCTYPDGKKVLCLATVQLNGGRIASQTSVQAWDP